MTPKQGVRRGLPGKYELRREDVSYAATVFLIPSFPFVLPARRRERGQAG